MPIPKPTKEQLAFWEEQLNIPVIEPNPYAVAPNEDDSTHYNLPIFRPAQPVRNGGMFWRERIYTLHKHERADRKRQLVSHACGSCGQKFEASKRAAFCSRKCQMRELMRKVRAEAVSAKLDIHSEENK
jgi:endogenous inhibitor of DNA gyrase (YacG/DUF329 family)